ncbi:hypothetical protein RintRC_7663 [Richelia intracellularis]|nr:hypothetical protein RintRC_7663 [Richelia intracellularis]
MNQQTANLQSLGCLEKFAAYPARLESFRNPATVDEICDCIHQIIRSKG